MDDEAARRQRPEAVSDTMLGTAEGEEVLSLLSQQCLPALASTRASLKSLPTLKNWPCMLAPQTGGHPCWVPGTEAS